MITNSTALGDTDPSLLSVEVYHNLPGPLISKHRREKNFACLDLEFDKVLLIDRESTDDYQRKRYQWLYHAAAQYCSTIRPDLKELAEATKGKSCWQRKALSLLRADFVDRLCSGDFKAAQAAILTEFSPLLKAAQSTGFNCHVPLDETSLIRRKENSKINRKLTDTGARERYKWSADEIAALEQGFTVHTSKDGKTKWTEIAKIKILSDNGRTNGDCRDKFRLLHPDKIWTKKKAVN